MRVSRPLWWVAGLIMVQSALADMMASVPAAPQLDVPAYILMSYSDRTVLAEKDMHEQLDPASLTKMMVVYVVDQELDRGNLALDEMVLISEKAWRTEGSRMFVEVGSEVSVEDLLRGIIIQSGNDATVAIAEHVAGSEEAFVAMMNEQAQRLGMSNTHFMNAPGLPEAEHYTSAYDLALLSQALVRDFPDSYELYSEKWFTHNGIKQNNRNRLLWREPYVDGIKSGRSSTAGWCLVASGKQNDTRLISVIIGAPDDDSRTRYSQKLLRYGFRFFESHKLFDAAETVKEARVWMGQNQTLPLGLQESLEITMPKNRFERLKAEVTLNSEIKAPVQAGMQLGQLQLSFEDELVKSVPLVALSPVERGSLWSRVTDYVSLTSQKWFNPKVEG